MPDMLVAQHNSDMSKHGKTTHLSQQSPCNDQCCHQFHPQLPHTGNQAPALTAHAPHNEPDAEHANCTAVLGELQSRDCSACTPQDPTATYLGQQSARVIQGRHEFHASSCLTQEPKDPFLQFRNTRSLQQSSSSGTAFLEAAPS
jgi:hypothetical protein